MGKARRNEKPPEVRHRRGRHSRQEAPLNWPALGALFALAVAVLVWIVRVEPGGAHLEQLRQQGAFFHTVKSSARLWSTFRWALGAESFGNDDPFAVTATKLRNGSALAFVPNTLSFSLASVPAALREELEALRAESKGDLLQKHPGLAVALAAFAVRLAGQGAPRASLSPAAAWLRSLPDEWPYSWRFTADQRSALQGTLAMTVIKEHDEMLASLKELRVQEVAGGRGLTDAEAAWVLGLLLHHGQDDESFLVPGLLDGLVRHWDLQRCAAMARNAAPTGRLPGWALVAAKDMALGEQVYICTGLANGRLLPMYGVAHPGNPNGAVFSQGRLDDSALDALLQEAQGPDCDRIAVRSLFLRRDVKSVISNDNVKCSSLAWMGSAKLAGEAIQAGYFDSWPRNNATTSLEWRMSEAYFYVHIATACNKSMQGIVQGADNVTLSRLQQDKHSELSKLVVLVRDEEVRLFELCFTWASDRASKLGGVLEHEQTNQAQPEDYDEL